MINHIAGTSSASNPTYVDLQQIANVPGDDMLYVINKKKK